MDIATAPDPTTQTSAKRPRLLCAYSPRWLSGPTPGYKGLCPTWSADDSDASDRDAS